MRWQVVFSDGGVPETGLSPTISVWRYEDGSSAGTPPTVTEISAGNAPGWYAFEAAPERRILVTIDGTDTLPDADRYVHLVISPNDYPEQNRRTVYSSWDSRGNPLEGRVLLYGSAEDCEADEAPWSGAEQSFSVRATYDAARRLSSVVQLAEVPE